MTLTMKHLGTKKLFTKRLILRRFELSDIVPMFNNWASDDEVTKYLTWRSHENIGVTNEVVSDWVSQYRDPRFYQWCIEFEAQPIGSINAVENDGKWSIGYLIGRKWWGNGFMSEIVPVVVNFLLEDVGLDNVWAWHYTDNVISGKILRKCGFRFVKFDKKRTESDETATQL